MEGWLAAEHHVKQLKVELQIARDERDADLVWHEEQEQELVLKIDGLHEIIVRKDAEKGILEKAGVFWKGKYIELRSSIGNAWIDALMVREPVF
jgi:hypothetical protein